MMVLTDHDHCLCGSDFFPKSSELKKCSKNGRMQGAPRVFSWRLKIRGFIIGENILSQILIDERLKILRYVLKDWRFLPKCVDFLTLKTKDWRYEWQLWRLKLLSLKKLKTALCAGSPMQPDGYKELSTCHHTMLLLRILPSCFMGCLHQTVISLRQTQQFQSEVQELCWHWKKKDNSESWQCHHRLILDPF